MPRNAYLESLIHSTMCCVLVADTLRHFFRHTLPLSKLYMAIQLCLERNHPHLARFFGHLHKSNDEDEWLALLHVTFPHSKALRV